MWSAFRKPSNVPSAADALPGRSAPILTAATHLITGRSLMEPYPDTMEMAMVGMGCFWGAERMFWKLPGVHITAVGYAAGATPNPTYEETCTGQTGHNEVVRIVYDPATLPYGQILKTFWEGHDPTQGMRQGNDVGTQYRSGLYVYSADQLAEANASKQSFGAALNAKGRDAITTEILPAPDFYFAEDYHQQYLAKNPNGYCGLGGTGIKLDSV